MSRKLALIIGNDDYEDSTLSRLVTPGADTADLARVLTDPNIGAFDEVTTLLNKPTHEVRRSIAHFFARKKRSDLLVLYFTGHGVLDEGGRLHLAATNTEHDLLSATAVPAAFITDEMDRCRSQRQVLILDCCHSGAFARGAKGPLGVNVRTPAAFEGNGTGRIVLTATNATQYAWEGNEIIGSAENSVFTYHLVQGLESGAADTNNDGYVTLEELYEYVYEQVVCSGTEARRQTPGKWSYRQHGEIVLARNPHLPAQVTPLPADLRQVIESSHEWLRRAVVEELRRLLDGGNEILAPAAYAALQQLASDPSPQVATAASRQLADYETARASELESESKPDDTIVEVMEMSPDVPPPTATLATVASTAPEPSPQKENEPAVLPDPTPRPAIVYESTPPDSPDRMLTEGAALTLAGPPANRTANGKNGRYPSLAPAAVPSHLLTYSPHRTRSGYRRPAPFTNWALAGILVAGLVVVGLWQE